MSGYQPLDLSKHPKEERLVCGTTLAPWPAVKPEQPEIKWRVGTQVQLQ